MANHPSIHPWENYAFDECLLITPLQKVAVISPGYYFKIVIYKQIGPVKRLRKYPTVCGNVNRLSNAKGDKLGQINSLYESNHHSVLRPIKCEGWPETLSLEHFTEPWLT